ncbi:MAG: magnesium transporter [Nanoarchaeota archaeon]|nr:magnesium transporter [Nanoarchaeota archaeon]MBU1134992.1 magnesium transporter [Nanoarchaeota archaeon]MBU2520079.1 magnesium transporter [Nanoarchaeota archaeon]
MKNLFDSDFSQTLYWQVIAIIGGLFAGSLLAIYTNQILLIPGIFIILPGFLDMRGNIGGSLTSRLSSGLLVGVISPRKMWKSRIVRGNTLASFFSAVIISLILGLTAFFVNYVIFGVVFFNIIFIALFAVIIANVIEIPLAIFLTFHFFKKGVNPDNVMGPIVAMTGDVVSIFSLLISILILTII